MKALMNILPQRYVLKALLVASVAAFLALVACQLDGRVAEPTVPAAAEPTVPAAAEPIVPAAAEPTVPAAAEPTVPAAAEVMEITIGPDLADCVGVAPQKCLVVNGTLFYGSIDDFIHNEGYTLRLKVERYDAWPDLDEPPQDADRYGYRIIEIVSRTWDYARGPLPTLDIFKDSIRPALDIFNDNAGIYLGDGLGMLIRPPSSVQEMVDNAEVIAIGSVGAVVGAGLQAPYNKADNTRLDEYNEKYGHPSPYPTPYPSAYRLPYVDYWIDVETVILDDGTISSGKPLILRMFGRWVAVRPYPWMIRLPIIGERRLYALVANPEGKTHSLSNHWEQFSIDGDQVTHTDDLRSPVYFTDQVKPDDFIKALENAVDHKNE